MLAKVFASAVQSSFHRGDAGVESDGNLGVTPTLLHEGKQRAVLRAKLSESMAESV